MIVINTPVSPYLQNAPIVYCDKTKKSIFVDPGDEAEKLISVSEEHNLKPEFILITHGHIDHAGAAVELAQKYDLKIIGPHKDDKFLLDTLDVQGQMYGVKAKNFIPDRWLTHNDSIEFADFKLQILHCPGHSPSQTSPELDAVGVPGSGATVTWEADAAETQPLTSTETE